MENRISYYDVECFYPKRCFYMSIFEIALDMLYYPNKAKNLRLLGLIWIRGEIEKQFRKVWKEFKEILEVF